MNNEKLITYGNSSWKVRRVFKSTWANDDEQLITHSSSGKEEYGVTSKQFNQMIMIC